MAEEMTVDVGVVPMAEIPPMTLRLTEAGVMQVAAIIASLKESNDQLLASLTSVQAVSTQQVERIRLLEAEVATLRALNEMLDTR